MPTQNAGKRKAARPKASVSLAVEVIRAGAHPCVVVKPLADLMAVDELSIEERDEVTKHVASIFRTDRVAFA